jgi:hypothetical protein
MKVGQDTMKLGQETVGTSASLQRSISNMSLPCSESSLLSNESPSKLSGSRPVVKSKVTGNIEFVSGSVMRSSSMRISRGRLGSVSSSTASVDYLESAYKLIDLGSAVAVHDEEVNHFAETMMTVSEMAFAG